jgi:1,2-diacylglycerol 3-beta-galactosyltransferase
MDDKRRILVLTSDAGFGHRSAANAVAAAILDKYGEECEVHIANPMEDRRAPFFLRDASADYDRVVRNTPELYRFYYDASDTSVTSAIVESALTVLLFEVLRDVVRTYQPDTIVTTYPLYITALDAFFTVTGRDIPLIAVVTDLANVHRMWFSKSVDACLVPTSNVLEQALGYGLAQEQVHVTGIPVNPQAVKDPRSRADIQAGFGWRTDLPTILAVGSKRVERLMDTLNVLNHFGAPLQLVVAAGRDERLYHELQAVDWHVPVHLYEYAHNVPLMMRGADALICKAGGLIVTEALAVGCPMILIDLIQGQETGNAEYVVANGAADLARSDVEVLEVMAHLMKDEWRLLRERALNAASLGHPFAAYDVADMAYQFAQRGSSAHRHLLSRRTLIDLLNRNQVRWGDTRELKDPRNQ